MDKLNSIRREVEAVKEGLDESLLSGIKKVGKWALKNPKSVAKGAGGGFTAPLWDMALPDKVHASTLIKEPRKTGNKELDKAKTSIAFRKAGY